MTNIDRRGFAVGLGAVLIPKCLAAAAPPSIEQLVSGEVEPDQALGRLVQAVVETMGTDRCFVYMRDPRRKMTAYTHGFSRLADWRSFDGGTWGPEADPETISEPMLKKAYRDPTPLFIDDIETAAPETLNRSLERSVFGHRALVHAPIYFRGNFYGILETAVRDSPRVWTSHDRALISWLQPRAARLAAGYLGHI